MMGDTKIPYLIGPDGKPGKTWNPITGCSPVSESCTNCYAEAMSKRFGWPWGKPVFHPERLEEPLWWWKPKRVLVCSMSDLFHEAVRREWLYEIINIMSHCRTPEHTFLILTKRPLRMKKIMSEYIQKGAFRHVWLGVTAENQQLAEERIPLLLQTPAAIRWVSVEPCLSEIDLTRIGGDDFGWFRLDALTGQQYERPIVLEEGIEWESAFTGNLSWVVAGCESGPRRRPAPWDWFRSLRDQCVEVGVPFFLKQMAENEDGTGRVVHMPELDGRRWMEFPRG